jgi:hypothetical protein
VDLRDVVDGLVAEYWTEELEGLLHVGGMGEGSLPSTDKPIYTSPNQMFELAGRPTILRVDELPVHGATGHPRVQVLVEELVSKVRGRDPLRPRLGHLVHEGLPDVETFRSTVAAQTEPWLNAELHLVGGVARVGGIVPIAARAVVPRRHVDEPGLHIALGLVETGQSEKETAAQIRVLDASREDWLRAKAKVGEHDEDAGVVAPQCGADAVDHLAKRSRHSTLCIHAVA